MRRYCDVAQREQENYDAHPIALYNDAISFSRTPSKIQKAPSADGADTEAVLADWAFSKAEIAELKSGDVIR